MKDTGTFLRLVSEFILTHFKDYRVWDVEITFPQSAEETAAGFYTHGLLELSASDKEGNWDSYTFEFNSPDKLDKEMFELFDAGTLSVYVKNDSIVIWYD